MKTTKPLFIVIEGLDGSGKSTAARRLAELLDPTKSGSILLTHEPNEDFCAGRFIRQILRKEDRIFHPRILALAYATNRLDHCTKSINPFLDSADAAGRMVISDRFWLSSLVYQSSAEFKMNDVFRLNELARQPDLTFFLKVRVSVCRERLRNRNQPLELFEENFAERRLMYARAIRFLRKKTGERIVEIDASGSVETTVEAMLKILNETDF